MTEDQYQIERMRAWTALTVGFLTSALPLQGSVVDMVDNAMSEFEKRFPMESSKPYPNATHRFDAGKVRDALKDGRITELCFIARETPEGQAWWNEQRDLNYIRNGDVIVSEDARKVMEAYLAQYEANKIPYSFLKAST